MPTSKSEGSQTATLDTEHFPGSAQTDTGTYVLMVDCSNMVNGDVTRLKMYVKPRSASTSAVAYSATYAHAQADPVKISPPVPSLHEVKWSLEQTDGTGRAYDYNLMTLE